MAIAPPATAAKAKMAKMTTMTKATKTTSGGGASQTRRVASWTNTSSDYDRILGPGTVKGAERMVDLTTALHPITATSRILDVGTGPGAVTRTIRRRYGAETGTPPILAVDLAPGMLRLLRQRGLPGVTAALADATALDRTLVPSGAFTHAYTALVLQFCGSRQPAVLAELFRALAPGGVATASLSRDINVGEPFHAACAALDPAYAPTPTHEPRAWMTTAELEAGMRAAGFVDVRSELVWAAFVWRSRADYVDYWLAGTHPAFARELSGWSGDRERLRPVLEQILRDRYDDPPRLGCNIAMVVGRKPSE